MFNIFVLYKFLFVWQHDSTCTLVNLILATNSTSLMTRKTHWMFLLCRRPSVIGAALKSLLNKISFIIQWIIYTTIFQFLFLTKLWFLLSVELQLFTGWNSESSEEDEILVLVARTWLNELSLNKRWLPSKLVTLFGQTKLFTTQSVGSWCFRFK